MGTNTLHAFVKEPPLVSTTQDDFGWKEMECMGTNALHAFVKDFSLVSTTQENFGWKKGIGWKQIRCMLS